MRRYKLQLPPATPSEPMPARTEQTTARRVAASLAPSANASVALRPATRQRQVAPVSASARRRSETAAKNPTHGTGGCVRPLRCPTDSIWLSVHPSQSMSPAQDRPRAELRHPTAHLHDGGESLLPHPQAKRLAAAQSSI